MEEKDDDLLEEDLEDEEDEEGEERLWEVEVIESRDYTVNYVVRACSEDEARQKAESGDTEEEHEIKLEGVTDRTVMEDPSPCD